MQYDNRHGGPFDRGFADYWYHRPQNPHYYVDGAYNSLRIERDQMTQKEINAYLAGYAQAEQRGEQKEW